MSVIVKGMKMPENCIKCPLQFGGWCYASPPEIDERVAPTVDEAWEQGKPDWCPLVALPDHHGRLGDLDALIIDLMDRGLEGVQTDDWAEIQQTVMEQPTIVESEGES